MSFMHKVKIDGCKVKWIGNANQYNKQSILLSISAPRDFKNKDPKDHIFYSMFVSIDCSKHQIPSLGDKVSVELFPMIKERKDKDGNPAIDHNGYAITEIAYSITKITPYVYMANTALPNDGIPF